MFENNGTKNKSNMHRCFVPPRYVIWTHNKDNAVCWGVLPKTAFGGFTAATPSRSTRTLLNFSESNGYCLLYWSYHHQVALISYNKHKLVFRLIWYIEMMLVIMVIYLIRAILFDANINQFISSSTFEQITFGRCLILIKNCACCIPMQ